MKHIAASIALIFAVVSGTANAIALENWFDGGIGEGWPTNAAMFGGTWRTGAESVAKMSGNVLQIVSDEDDAPLSFDATEAKPLGKDTDVKSVLVTCNCSFLVFPRDALPDIPAEAKGAVILVSNDAGSAEPESGTLYYAAYDDKAGVNVWKDSGVPAAEMALIEFSMQIANGDAPGLLSVKYMINDWTVTVPVKSPDAIVDGVKYSGVGSTDSLRSKFMPRLKGILVIFR